MIDARGDLIQGSFFNRLAIEFFPKVVQGKVYLVSNGQIGMSNKKFTAIKTDYCIRFIDSTEFLEVPDDPKISCLGYQFSTIRQISENKDVAVVDVIGVILQVGEVQQFTLKTDLKSRERRCITIADDSKMQISVTLWGEAAILNSETIENGGLEVGKLIVLKNCRVSQYQGLSLNQSGDLKDICFKLAHPRALAIRTWFGSRKISEHLTEC